MLAHATAAILQGEGQEKLVYPQQRQVPEDWAVLDLALALIQMKWWVTLKLKLEEEGESLQINLLITRVITQLERR